MKTRTSARSVFRPAIADTDATDEGTYGEGFSGFGTRRCGSERRTQEAALPGEAAFTRRRISANAGDESRTARTVIGGC